MTIGNSKKFLPVLEHYANGGDIEYRVSGDQWKSYDDKIQFKNEYEFRIKLTPPVYEWQYLSWLNEEDMYKLNPFYSTEKEALLKKGAWVKLDCSKRIRKVENAN